MFYLLFFVIVWCLSNKMCWLDISWFSLWSLVTAHCIEILDKDFSPQVIQKVLSIVCEILKHCVTQLMLYTGEKLSSPIFCCLSVCQASVSPDQISTFSNIYRHTSPMLTLYHVIPSSASFYWPSTTKYQTVSPYTDPVPAGTTYNSPFRRAQLNNFSFYDSFDESRTVYLV